MSFADIEAGSPVAGTANGKQDPSQALASGIFQIYTAVSIFQRLVNTIGTAKDTPDLREKLNKTRLRIEQLVKDVSEKLGHASELDHNAGVSARKQISDARLARDFEAALKEFEKAQCLAAERESAFDLPSPPSDSYAGDADLNSDPSQEERAALTESKRQDTLLLDNEIVLNEAVIEEREQ